MVGPERWGGSERAQAVVIVRPATDLQRRGALVCVLDFEDCDRGKVVVDGDLDFLAKSTVVADYGQALAGAERVGDLVGLGGG